MSTKNDSIVSPVGTIQFMALARPVKKYDSEDAPLVYTIRLKFDSATAEGKAFKKTIEAINPNLIGTKHTDKATEYTVRAASRFEVVMTDAKGNELEEAPLFFADSKGTAKMSVKPYTGNKMGGSINLEGVTICSLETNESNLETKSHRQQILENLQKSVDQGV